MMFCSPAATADPRSLFLPLSAAHALPTHAVEAVPPSAMPASKGLKCAKTWGLALAPPMDAARDVMASWNASNAASCMLASMSRI